MAMLGGDDAAEEGEPPEMNPALMAMLGAVPTVWALNPRHWPLMTTDYFRGVGRRER
jgi:hypothetical protein